MITNKKCLLAGLVLAVVVSVGIGSTVRSASEDIVVFDCADLQVCFSLDTCAHLDETNCPIDLIIAVTNNSGFDVDDLEMDVDHSVVTTLAIIDGPVANYTDDTDGTGTWDIPTIPPGGTETLTLKIRRPLNDGCYLVKGTLRSTDPYTDSIGWVGDFVVCAELCFEDPKLCMQICVTNGSGANDDKIFCRENAAGYDSNVQYVLKVLNDGPCDLDENTGGTLTITVVKPSGLDDFTLTDDDGGNASLVYDDIVWTFDLADGDCDSIAFNADINSSGIISVTATVSDGPDCLQVKDVSCSTDLCP